MQYTFDDTGARAKLSQYKADILFNAIRNEAHAWAIEEEGKFRETRLNGRPVLKRWTGNLARSLVPIWDYTAQATRAGFQFLPTMQGPNGSFENYANINETGGTIRPKNGRFLAWPVKGGPAMTAGGVGKFGDSARNYPGKLFFFKSKSGNMFLAENQGSKGRKLGPVPPKMVYHLASSVEIPARLGFRNFSLPALRRAERRMEGAMSSAVSRIGGAP